MARKTPAVMGVTAPAPRITGRAIWLVASRLALPLILGLVAFDVLVWWVAATFFDTCAAIWCWF